VTYQDAAAEFKRDVLPGVVERYGATDGPAIRGAWNDWTDGLCRDGRISERQRDVWLCPVKTKG
jgi:hypothetical protein